MWAYFYHKLVAFLHEHVCVFILNTMQILCFKNIM